MSSAAVAVPQVRRLPFADQVAHERPSLDTASRSFGVSSAPFSRSRIITFAFVFANVSLSMLAGDIVKASHFPFGLTSGKYAILPAREKTSSFPVPSAFTDQISDSW